MKQYTVTGMSCAACSSRVEKAVSKVDGVKECSVSLLTNSMAVEGDASPEAVINAVEQAGYGARLNAGKQKRSLEGDSGDMLKDRETPVLKKRLVSSLVFLGVLMYFSMGHMMWDWPVPSFFENNHVAMGIMQFILTIIVLIINQKFYLSGFKGLIHRAPNMDTLVALGSGSALVYSIYVLFAMTDAQTKGNTSAVMGYMHDFYFESAAMIVALITLGKMLEARSKGKTTDAIRGLIELAPKTATLIENDTERTVPVEDVEIGDIFAVKPGESIPVDGVVIQGSSAVNEAALTGESIPVDKTEGDRVSAATINQSGYIVCRATEVGEDTALSKIIQMVKDAAATKAPIAKIADRVSGVFVPIVIVIAAVTAAVWFLIEGNAAFALARGISVLVISCPCALGLATPVAIMVGSGIGAKNAIMFKNAVSLEETGKIKIAVLDKTGTITMGKPKVTDIIPAEGIAEEELLKMAYSFEKKSEHPLAAAVVEYGNEKGLEAEEITDFKALPGNGLTGKYGNKELSAGNLVFIRSKSEIQDSIKLKSEALAAQGKTPLFFAIDGKLTGVIAVADVIKEDSREAIRELKNMGIYVVMLTGDNRRTAEAVGEQAGVDTVIADVLPDGKDSIIRMLKEKGKTAMVGDGINDAPALTSADIGIAIGAGTDIAIDAADIVLMKNSLKDAAAAVRLSRQVLKNIKENLFWAFIYNIIGIPLAAGVFIPFMGWELNPMFAAAAMSLSSFCVVTNALRLNLFNVHSSKKDRKAKYYGASAHAINKALEKYNISKEENKMEKTMKIEGMMCGHCEARVKKCLEGIEGVSSADVSHEKGSAVVTLTGEVSDEVLKSSVEAQDYKVISIE